MDFVFCCGSCAQQDYLEAKCTNAWFGLLKVTPGLCGAWSRCFRNCSRIMYPAVYPRILYSNLAMFGILGVGLVSQDNYGGSLPHNTIRKPLLVACVNCFQ